MVQVINERLQQRKPNLGERLGAGIGAGLQAAGKVIPEYMMDKQKLEKQKKQADTLSKLVGFDVSDISPDLYPDILKSHLEQRKAEKIEGIKQQGKRSQLEDKLNFAKQIFGNRQQQQPQGVFSEEFGGAYPQDKQQSYEQFSPQDLSDEDIITLSSIDPNLGRAAGHAKDVALREQTAQRKADQQMLREAKKETLPIRKEYVDKGKTARELIANKENLLQKVRLGKIDDPLMVYISGLLPAAVGNKLLSTDTQVYKAGLFDEFGVLRTMFPGATRVKEIELLEDKLATLDKNREAKEEILKTGIKKLERDVILAKAARNVEKRHPGASLVEFDELVQEEAQPYLDALYEEMRNDYEKTFIKHAEPYTKFKDDNGDIFTVKKTDLEKFLKSARLDNANIKVIR